mgnify:CR=1 FL=1
MNIPSLNNLNKLFSVEPVTKSFTVDKTKDDLYVSANNVHLSFSYISRWLSSLLGLEQRTIDFTAMGYYAENGYYWKRRPQINSVFIPKHYKGGNTATSLLFQETLSYRN